MYRTAKTLALFASATLATSLPAQTHDDGALWLAALATGRFADPQSDYGNLRWWLEGQGRWRNEGEDLELAFVRPGVGYALSSRTTVWLGYGLFDTDPVGRPSFLEHRVWQQLSWNAPVEGFTLSSRTRVEQRFVEDESETGWRLRQMVKFTLPLTESKGTFLSVWDEGFYDANDTRWGERTGFRQNRAFAGLGFFLNDAHKHSLEVGYLNQWIDRTTVDAENHALLVMLFLNF